MLTFLHCLRKISCLWFDVVCCCCDGGASWRRHSVLYGLEKLFLKNTACLSVKLQAMLSQMGIENY